MACRRIARTVGAAAGGLLGVAFLPSAVAFADGTYDGYDLIGNNDFIGKRRRRARLLRLGSPGCGGQRSGN